jgi:outer membrane protein OmpA-like peptidoglycan-associated protein
MLMTAAIAVLAVSACGGGSKSSSKTHRSAPTTTTASSTATKSTSTSTSASSFTPAVPAFDFLADSTLKLQERLHVSILDIRRSGPFVTLDFEYTCLEPLPDGCFPATDFSGNGNQTSGTADGTVLVDPVNDVEYQPVRDREGRYYGSTLPNNDSAGDAPGLAWVKFAAPPASVTSLDVLFPSGGPQISNVPIDTGPAPTATQVGGGATAAAAAPFSQGPDSANTAELALGVVPLTLTVGSKRAHSSQSGSRTTVTLSADVLFAFDKATLTPRAHDEIAQLAAKLKANSTGVVAVDGYTDSIGSDVVNVPLSRRRAQAVADALRAITGPSIRYRSVGYGSADPVAPNTTSTGADDPAGRRLNRRVTVSYVIKRKPPAPKPAPAPQTSSTTSTSAASSLSATFRVTAPSQGTTTYTATIASLYRIGNLLALRFTAQCLSSTDQNGCDSDQGIGDFAATTTVVPPLPLGGNGTTNQGVYHHAGGVYLIDPGSGLYYNAVGAGPAVLTAELNSGSFGTLPYPLWSYFPAPPASVTSITVALPGGDVTIPNVPISPGPPPVTDTGAPLSAGAPVGTSTGTQTTVTAGTQTTVTTGTTTPGG